MLYLKSDNLQQILQQGSSATESHPQLHTQNSSCHHQCGTPGTAQGQETMQVQPGAQLAVLGGKQESCKTLSCSLSYLTAESKKHDCCPVVLSSVIIPVTAGFILLTYCGKCCVKQKVGLQKKNLIPFSSGFSHMHCVFQPHETDFTTQLLTQCTERCLKECSTEDSC